MGMKPIGTKQFQKKMNVLKQALPKEIDSFLIDIGMRLLGMTKMKTNVITGNLRRNWKITKVVESGKVKMVEVYNNVVYAPHYEFGTEKMEGRYPLNRSVSELESQMENLTESFFKRTIGDLTI